MVEVSKNPPLVNFKIKTTWNMSMKQVYCANCGLKIPVIRKAVKQLNRIIEVIEPHECTEEPVELDLTPIDCPTFKRDDNKMIKNLKSSLPIRVNASREELKDLRPSEVAKSTAPDSILNQFNAMLMKGGDKT